MGVAKYRTLYSLSLSTAINYQKNIFLKIVFALFFSLFFAHSTPAVAEVLGIVGNRRNTDQWSEIKQRLQRVGTDYCTIDLQTWEQELDLGTIKVLLLPNIETLNLKQVRALQVWMNKGGKVIVTGPTGTVSQPEVQTQLRSLLGAYWDFELAISNQLQLTDNTPVQWFGKSQLSRLIRGGKLIPTHETSQTAAIWSGNNGEFPAAVINDNTTFLGWRWGLNRVAPASLDIAWLQAALSRYGIKTNGHILSTSVSESSACNPRGKDHQQLPSLFSERRLTPNMQLLPNSRLGLIRETPLAPELVEEMTQELTGLIERFEASLLTAEANHSDIDLSTTQVIEQLLSRNLKENKPVTSKVGIGNKNAYRALQTAKNNLQTFHSLIGQRSYTQAKRKWLQARNALWDNYPTDRQLSQPEVRAMWLDRGTIVKAKSEFDLAKIFDRMATAGINTVFFETVNSGYTIHPSRIAPEQNPLVRGWDPLKAAVKLAHERNMELHAWVWTFATVNQRHNKILNLPEDYLGPVLSRYPDWAITDRSGSRFHYNSGKAFLDPAHPGVQRYLSLLFEEITTEYDVDGLHLDYIRYPFQNHDGTINYGYGQAARQQFQQQTGIDPTELQLSHPLWSQWTGFRIRQVDNFVSSISQRLKQQRPELILSTAVFPMPRQERLTKIQQHWEEWIRQAWIDLLVPMTYALETDHLQKLARPVIDQSREANTLVLPGIRLLNVPDVVAIDQMQLLRGMSTEGFALFAAENLDSHLAETFGRTHTNLATEANEPLPYRQPFQATLSRYRSLQKEWNFLIVNNQLSIEESTFKEWGKQADRLAEDLEQLAAEPSMRHFLSTQLALASFRRQFPKWMDKTESIQPYQANIWQNRLATLDRLLNYGERKILSQKN